MQSVFGIDEFEELLAKTEPIKLDFSLANGPSLNANDDSTLGPSYFSEPTTISSSSLFGSSTSTEIPTKLGKKNSITRKKRQKPTVTAACQECRSKHTKCDGQTPCSSCVKKAITCIYETARKKRGPAPGKVKQLEHVITILAKEMNKPNENENQLCISSMFGTYVDSYNALLYPLIGIPPLFRDFDPFFNSATNEEKAYMYSLLANGAMAFGNSNHVESFLSSARSCIVDIFDRSDMKIAASYSLMGLCLASRGLIDQGRNCNAMALSICKNLKNQDIKDPLLETIYRGCMVGVVELCESKHEQWATLDHVLAELGQYKNIEGFKIQIFSILVAKILLMCSNSDVDNVAETFGLLEEAEKCVPHTSPLRIHITTILTSVRALLFFFSGMPEASMECIREVDSVLTEVPPIYWFPGLLLASLLVIQIRLAYDFPIHDDILRLRKTGENYPIATLITQQILDPSCTKYIPLIPVIPSLGFTKTKQVFTSCCSSSSISGYPHYLDLESLKKSELALTESLLKSLSEPLEDVTFSTPNFFSSPSSAPKKSINTPLQVTIWYQTEEQKQTYRITPSTTIGDLIEQTPVSNHSQFVLLDQRGAVLPRNAYIVQLFKEEYPILKLRKVQSWD